MKLQPYTTISEYIAQFPAKVQAVLENFRTRIHKIAPSATETISYAIPTFKLNGTNLIHFAAFTRHVSIFPGGEAVEVFAAKLSEYKTSKGTIQFPLDKPIPYELVDEITKYRIELVSKKKLA